ncbi:hypothetical protein [Sulfuricurvum sp.]|uniref:hypothetical protein n=1 Tax=Sulfuricurvum sp. TaxID=2025608 RepID=UPI00263392F9|nr:hypothetical protein [Sulfuricurvum sp.]MDD3597173.1 hypothetical protein [Sulfuricurvum sp.]
MKKEYNFSKGVRGKYAASYHEGVNIVKIDEDVTKVFSDSKSGQSRPARLDDRTTRSGSETFRCRPSRKKGDSLLFNPILSTHTSKLAISA